MDGVTPVPYEPPPAPPPYPPRMDPRQRRVLLAVAVVWALVLGTIGIWYSLHGRPSAREQTTIAQAQPTVDQAVENVVRAAGGTAVPAVFGYEKASDCHVTPVRDGATYERAVWLYTKVGGEPALLDRIASGLPAGYGAKAHHPPGGAPHTLTADAGFFVTVDGTTTVPGLVTVKAGTGCRTLGHQPATDPAGAPGPDPLGISGEWRMHSLPCGLRTAEVAGPATRPWATLPRDQAVVATDDVYALASGVAAHRAGDTVTVTATTGSC